MPAPFTTKPVCPKCTSTDVGVLHDEPDSEYEGRDARIPKPDQRWAETHEHIDCRCTRCGFPWIMRCADASTVMAAEREARQGLAELEANAARTHRDILSLKLNQVADLLAAVATAMTYSAREHPADLIDHLECFIGYFGALADAVSANTERDFPLRRTF